MTKQQTLVEQPEEEVITAGEESNLEAARKTAESLKIKELPAIPEEPVEISEETEKLMKEKTENLAEHMTKKEEEIAIKCEGVKEPKIEKRSITIIDTEPTSVMNPQAYLQVKAIAKDYFEGGILPKSITSPMTVLYIIQAGMEMGLKPIESIQSLYPVNGNLNFWGKAVVNRLRVHGWTIKYYDEAEDSVSAEVTNGKETYNETLTFAECEKSGNTN